MIRRFGHVAASPELVRSIFIDAEAWPTWLPGVHTATVLDRTETTLEVEAGGRFMGHRMHGVFDCRIEPEGFFQHQRIGWLKRWDSHWHFLTPPDGHGTTAVCELEVDAGLIGALVPGAFVRRFVDRVVAETIVNLNARAAEITALPVPGPSAAGDGDTETLLEIFETPVGFEVLVGDRRINIESKD